MKTLDMTGFKYQDGNKLEFDGSFGRVIVTYYAGTKKEDLLPVDPTRTSYFEACILSADNTANTLAEGVGPDSALVNVYSEFSKNRAMEDLGVM